MIPIDLYPEHEWIINHYDGFQTLTCLNCGYDIQERFENEPYIKTSIGHIVLTNNHDNIEEARNNLLTCAEVIIKNIIE